MRLDEARRFVPPLEPARRGDLHPRQLIAPVFYRLLSEKSPAPRAWVGVGVGGVGWGGGVGVGGNLWNPTRGAEKRRRASGVKWTRSHEWRATSADSGPHRDGPYDFSGVVLPSCTACATPSDTPTIRACVDRW